MIKLSETSKTNRKVILGGWRRRFLFTLIFILTYFILITAVAPKRYNLVEGDIAKVDIKANRNIIDEEATLLKEQEVSEKVPKQYALKGEVKIQASENITTFFNKLINLKSNNASESEKLAQIKKITAFTLTDEEYKVMLGLSVEKATEFQWVVQGIIDKIYENNIDENKDEDITAAKDIVDRELLNSEIESDIKEILRDMAYSQIKPNYVFDKEKTDELIREALKSVTKVMIKKNQIIVKEGEPITQRQISILTELGIAGEGVGKGYLITYIILGVFLFLVSFLQYSYLKKEKDEIFKNIKSLILIAILNVLHLILARGIGIISPFLIPLACTPILMTVLLDYKVSVIINVLNAALVMVIVGFDPQITLLLIVNIIIGAISLKKLNQRNDIIYSTLYIIVGVTISTLTSGILSSNDMNKIMVNVMFAALGALMSGVLAIGLLPFFESSFDIVTNLKLLELANPNNVLMKRLLMEASGTYHHSIMVANLAEVAAEEIGCNPIVARVGSYYHDIGKLKRPFFFGENLMGLDNPHNNIAANSSTLIIISHVKDGLDLANEHKLPKVIKDIICQHHGTTIVKYFYYTVKNASENPDKVIESDFQYPGPIPETKEAAIVMLADSVEAAVRSIKEPTMLKIEEMVNNIIKDKLSCNQLNNSDITLKDLEKIKSCFLRVLKGIYHQRIEYPKEK